MGVDEGNLHKFQPEKNTFDMVANPARGLLNEQGKENKRKKSGSAPPPPPLAGRSEKKINRRLHEIIVVEFRCTSIIYTV